MIKISDWLVDRCSVYYQMWIWVFGKSIHNTLRDECCSNIKKDPFYKRLWYAIKYPFWSLCYNICSGIENLSYKNNERKKWRL